MIAFLWVSLILSLVLGLFAPYAGRMQATGLWLGKALVPPEQASALPRGLQDALTDGSISRITFVVNISPFIVPLLAFFYAWWAVILSFFLFIVVSVFSKRSNIASNNLDYYLNAIHTEIGKRHLNYIRDRDLERAQIVEDLGRNVELVLSLYMNSGVPAPTAREASDAPFGDPEYLLEKHGLAA